MNPRSPSIIRRVALLALAVIALIAFGAPAHAGATVVTVDRERFLMGTRCTIRLEGGDRAELEAAATAAFDAMARLEQVTSNWRADSELSLLHARLAVAAGPVEVSPELFAVLASAHDWCGRSDGAFDATVEALTVAYDLRGEGRLPDAAGLAAARALVDGRAVALDPSARTVTVPRAGMAFDLGGIAKGAALDLAADVLRERGITRALLNLGGQFAAIGAPVGRAAWTVELADPRDRARGVTTVELRDRSVSTTSGSERSLVVGGTIVNHVLDPRTGHPVPLWGSAVVIAERAIDADAASTALAVLGPVAGRAWAARQPGLEALLLIPDRAAKGGVRIERVAPSAIAGEGTGR